MRRAALMNFVLQREKIDLDFISELISSASVHNCRHLGSLDSADTMSKIMSIYEMRMGERVEVNRFHSEFSRP